MFTGRIQGIIDHDDTNHISDPSSTGMFRLDKTAEDNSYRVC